MPETIGTAYIQIEPTTEGISGKISEALDKDADSAGKSAGGKLSSALGTAAKVGISAVAGATTAMAGFATSSVKAGAEFDSAMSQVAATMGKSVDEIGNLRDFAQEMGSTTAFSATQAAEALNYMALAGYDADTSMQMLPNVLNLAAAGGMELATASDMVTDAQSALGLSLDETGTMVDQMAKTSSSTNTSVQQLGDAFLKIGATARNVKGGTAELSTVLGIMADNGIKGAEGGTHLRNMLLSLQNPTDKGAAALDKLGVAVYDSDGNMRSMIDIIADMQKGLDGMSQESKDAMLSGIFNKTDLAAANALLGTTQERFAEVAGKIGDCKGAADDMAKTQLDNLAGDITLFQSALEGAKIAVSDSLSPTLREFVQFGSDGLSQLTEAFKEGGLSGAMDAFGTILADGLAMIIEKLPSFVDAGLQLLEALGQGLLDNLPLIVDSALEIATTLLDTLLENLPTIIEAGIEVISQLAIGIGEALPELVPTIVECVLNIVDTLIENADKLLDGAMALIEGLAEGLITALPQLIDRLPEIIESIVTFLVDHIPEILVFSLELMIQLAAALIEAIPDLVAAIPEIIQAIVDGLIEGIVEITSVGSDMVDGLWEGIKGAWDGLVSNVTSLGKKLVDKVKGFFEIGSPSKLFADEIGRWIPEGVAVGIETNTDSINNAIDDMVKETMVSPNLDMVNGVSDSYSNAMITSTGNADNNVLGIIAEYMPLILTAIHESGCSIEPDPDGIFRVVRKMNNQHKRATGVSALV